jgi:ABC-type polysaccharide/polyol phosphate export permease
MLNVIANALADIRAGIGLRRVWLALASEDIGDQHRRTALGPLWLLINYLAFAGTFIFIFERGSGIPNYQAYVATGLLVWFYIMETISQSVSLFVREESFIKGTTLPLSVYVMRLAAQSLIRAGYAALGCLAILLASGILPSASWGWSMLGILIILATTPAAIILFAFLGAYFPDSQFIVSNLMRIGMFITPVFWAYTGGGGLRQGLYYWNPFTYFLEIVRIPILSGDLPARSFLLCVAISLGLWFIALLLLGRFRKQVVFAL